MVCKPRLTMVHLVIKSEIRDGSHLRIYESQITWKLGQFPPIHTFK